MMMMLMMIQYCNRLALLYILCTVAITSDLKTPLLQVTDRNRFKYVFLNKLVHNITPLFCCSLFTKQNIALLFVYHKHNSRLET